MGSYTSGHQTTTVGELQMSDKTFYVRNWHPNRIMFKYAGLKYIVERRGSKEDTTALPVEAKSDPTVARWLKTGVLEEITQNEFVALASRVEDAPQGQLKRRASEVNIPIEGPSSTTPTVVARDLFDKEASKQDLMSPKLEWATQPQTTAEELGLDAEEEEVVVPRKKTTRARKTS